MTVSARVLIRAERN